jgi:hypothetical protein
MYTQRIGWIGILAGFGSAAFFLLVVATSAYSTASPQSLDGVFPSIEGAGKGDRLTHGPGKGASGNTVAVELSGASDVIVRDRNGNILFAVDHSARTTTVAKQRIPQPISETPKPVERELTEGCEPAFSPYVEPARARVIGRCVSTLFVGNNMVS